MTSGLGNIPRTGCYGIVNLPGWMPWCIRHMTRSIWSHAFIVLDEPSGIILEARPTGSAIGDISQYAGLPMLFSEPAPMVACGLTTAQGMIQLAAERWTHLGYGFTDIAALGAWYGLHIRIPPVTQLIKDEHRLVCSQLVSEWGDAYGADWLCGQPDPQFVTPGMLADRIAGPR